MAKMRVVFFGTPLFAATVLEALLPDAHAAAVFEVVGVVTRPDAVRGRGKQLVPSEVKFLAQCAGLPVLEPTDLRSEEFLCDLAALAPDVICVASYGKIIPPEVLDVARTACLNVHASLLPRWRGAAPIERAILAGDFFTGVSIMRVEEALDSGDYCRQSTTLIHKKTADDLRYELSYKGGVLLSEVLFDLVHGNVEWTPQDEKEVTYAQKLERGELNVHPSEDAVCFLRKVRASSRNHPSKLRLAGKTLIVERAQLPFRDTVDVIGAQREVLSCKVADPEFVETFGSAMSLVPSLAAGEAQMVRKRLLLGTAEGVVELVRVRPEGKGSMDASAFMQGVQGAKGAALRWESYE